MDDDFWLFDPSMSALPITVKQNLVFDCSAMNRGNTWWSCGCLKCEGSLE